MSVGSFEPCSKFDLFNEYDAKQITDYLFVKHHVKDDIHETVDYILKYIVNETKLNELIKKCKYFNKREIELDEKIENIYEKIKKEKDINNILRMEEDINSLTKKKEEKYKYLKSNEQIKFINNIILLNKREDLTKKQLDDAYLKLFLLLQHSYASI